MKTNKKLATSTFCKNVVNYIICSCSITHNFFAIHNKHNQLGKYHIKTPTILHKNNFYKLLSFFWGPKFHEKVHSINSKERPQALTKEDPIHEVKKDHKGPKF